MLILSYLMVNREKRDILKRKPSFFNHLGVSKADSRETARCGKCGVVAMQSAACFFSIVHFQKV
jgi:hypothetical protein